jgi:transposase
LLPVVLRRADHPGRKRLDNRKVLYGIMFVLYTGILREFLPQDLGFGSGMTCWRRLRDWHKAGVWQRLHQSLLAELNAAGALDWSRAVIDGSPSPRPAAPQEMSHRVPFYITPFSIELSLPSAIARRGYPDP